LNSETVGELALTNCERSQITLLRERATLFKS